MNILILLIFAFLAGCGAGSSDQSLIKPNLNREYTVKLINNNTPFNGRDHATSFLINNRIFLRGGFFRSPASSFQDYWFSDDFGITWIHISGSLLPTNEPFINEDLNLPGAYARFSSFNNLFWLIDTDFAWTSLDGLSWSKQATIPHNSSSELFNINLNNKSYWINPRNNIVWDISSNNLISFSRLIDVNFTPGYGSIVYKNKDYIYIAAGINSSGKFNNFIWRSNDGITWNKLVDENNKDITLPFKNLAWPCIVNDQEGNIWIVGGYDIEKNINLNNIWFSIDGINWSEAKARENIRSDSKLIPKHASTCIYDESNKRIISIAGKGGIDPDNDNASVTNNIFEIFIN